MIIIITIDVEGSHSGSPVDSLIYGKIGKEEFGITKIMNICDAIGAKGTFFLDIYEISLHGRQIMRQIVDEIAKSGHDIQLHTHPGWPRDERDSSEMQEWKEKNCLFDPQRPWMHQYNLAEQIEILNKGKTVLEQWTGNEIIAHRAGGYGASKTTLSAAKVVGLKMDFSSFRGHSNCRLKTNRNTITTIEGIVEIPVTGFYRPNYVTLPRLPIKRRFIKTDIDWAHLDELKFFYNEGERHGLNIMVLFMHSFSFIKFSPDFKQFEPDYRDIKRFTCFLEWAHEKGGRFITAAEFWNSYSSNPKMYQKRDYTPIYVPS
jgi:peptidoglycan/xylan/chitin deacetylase (PgdA/CDA1 family)